LHGLRHPPFRVQGLGFYELLQKVDMRKFENLVIFNKKKEKHLVNFTEERKESLKRKFPIFYSFLGNKNT